MANRVAQFASIDETEAKQMFEKNEVFREMFQRRKFNNSQKALQSCELYLTQTRKPSPFIALEQLCDQCNLFYAKKCFNRQQKTAVEAIIT